jgi:peptide/nickel transport system substrate-binding protein
VTAARDLENILNIGEGLLRYKPGTIELEPGLAIGMPVVSSDGLTYTFTLRDGIKFGDGSDFNAKIYAMQLTRLLHSGTNCPVDRSNYYTNILVTPYIKTFKALDDKTIAFTLNTPAVAFPAILANPVFAPTNPATFPVYGCVPLPPAPVYGVGPWYISQYKLDEQVVFEPNPYYNGSLKPKVGKVIVKYFADTQALSQAIQSGAIDIAWQTVDKTFAADFLDPLKKVSGLQIGTIDGGYIYNLVIDHTKAPTDNPNVLKAIASAIDRSALIDAIWGGWAAPAYSMIPPEFLGAANTFDKVYGAPDLVKAKQYLAASGYTKSKPLQLTMWSSSGAQVPPLIKQQLEATGAIQVELKPQQGDTYAVDVWGWYADYGDPSQILDFYIYQPYTSTNISKIQSGPLAEKARQLIALAQQADIETDQAKRAGQYQQIQDLYADLVVTLPLVLETGYIVYRDNIKGSAQYDYPETLNIGPLVEFNYSTLMK